jgi:hypothetical protein
MQISVLFATIFGALYFLLFEPDSPVAIALMALAPLGWLGLFSVRFFSERKKLKRDDDNQDRKEKPKTFIDPDELIKRKSKD